MPDPSTSRPRPARRAPARGAGARTRSAAGRSNLGKWTPAFAGAAVLVVVVIAGVSGNSSGDGTGPTSSPSTGSSVPSTASVDGNPGAVDGSLTVPPSTGPAVVIDTAAVQKTTITKTLAFGTYGDDVKRMQQRLTDLGFAPGGVDGAFGENTRTAVWAYEKLVLGTPAGEATGKITPEMWSTMQEPITIAPRRPGGAGTTHMEIYLPQQVGIVFTDDRPTLITHISSGDGQEWCDKLVKDTNNKGEKLPEPVESYECGISKTPGGVFKFYRRYEGNRQGPLGGMWNPVYFNYGIAVHGARSVPLHPASHGCIRIPMFISEYFPSLVDNGDRVYVWDGVKEPEQLTKREMTPPFNYPDPNAPTTTTSTTTTTTTTVAATTTAPKPTTTPAATTTAPATTAAPPTSVVPLP